MNPSKGACRTWYCDYMFRARIELHSLLMAPPPQVGTVFRLSQPVFALRETFVQGWMLGERDILSN